MQRIHITLGHCFQTIPDGYTPRASALTQVPAENHFPLASVLGSPVGWEAVSQAWLNPPCQGQGEPEGQEEEDCMWWLVTLF